MTIRVKKTGREKTVSHYFVQYELVLNSRIFQVVTFCLFLPFAGGGEAPRAISGRVIAATWWLFGFIMIATYTANLAAFLTVSR